MTEQIDTVDTENAELIEDSKVDIAATVEEIAAADKAGEKVETADTVTEDAFEATEAQITMAKQLGVSDEDIADMSEAQAIAYDAAARLDSKRQQRKGKPPQKQEDAVSVESSTDGTDNVDADTDGEFTEDDLYTPEGIARINKAMKDLAELKASDKKRGEKHTTSEQVRLQEGIDKMFDDLDPEIFAKFQPGETADIEPGSQVEARRNQVVSMAKAIQGASTEDISMEEALERALSVVAPAETEQAALNEDNDRRKTRGGQRLSAPSSTTQKHEKVYDNPHDKAIDEIYVKVNAFAQ